MNVEWDKHHHPTTPSISSLEFEFEFIEQRKWNDSVCD